ncbi:ferrous iron transport protein A [Helicobacter sp. MIT 05-5293]|uniref:FeoA family protein n=1 Tax=Helicobacter sp. MIT 05-5293 TaxID=1548149 RepID=UPI00068A1785|nr:FeoA family protein [Helicobacter sp. MIT 05-5293]TLD80567.1 ferrous iron transport protein A [Helicobacter sp. MIT 05-5293]
MTLYDAQNGKMYQVLSLNTQDSVLKNRFITLGITKGKTFHVTARSIGSLAIAIMINGVQIALRDSEAQKIEVQEVKTQEIAQIQSNDDLLPAV